MQASDGEIARIPQTNTGDDLMTIPNRFLEMILFRLPLDTGFRCPA